MPVTLCSPPRPKQYLLLCPKDLSKNLLSISLSFVIAVTPLFPASASRCFRRGKEVLLHVAGAKVFFGLLKTCVSGSEAGNWGS